VVTSGLLRPASHAALPRVGADLQPHRDHAYRPYRRPHGQSQARFARLQQIQAIVVSKGLSANSVYSATKAAVRSFARTWTTDAHDVEVGEDRVIAELVGCSGGRRSIQKIASVITPDPWARPSLPPNGPAREGQVAARGPLEIDGVEFLAGDQCVSVVPDLGSQPTLRLCNGHRRFFNV